jgi:hypothetical protein
MFTAPPKRGDPGQDPVDGRSGVRFSIGSAGKGGMRSQDAFGSDNDQQRQQEHEQQVAVQLDHPLNVHHRYANAAAGYLHKTGDPVHQENDR